MKEEFISRKKFLKHAALTGGGFLLGADLLAKSIPGRFDQISVGEDVFYFRQGEGQYDALRRGFNKRIDKFPQVIALCKNTTGVVAAVQYARTNKLPVAIKSGGHCMEGFSCSNGGMVINLSLLNKLKAVTTSFQYSKPRALALALKAFYAESQPIFFKNASAGLHKSFEDIKGCMPEVITVIRSAPGMIYQVNTLGGEVQNELFEQSSGFPYRDYNFFSELQAYYDVPAQAPDLLLKFESIQHIFEKNGISAQYRNYPDINFKNPMEQYYGKNLDKLKSIKNRYDPENNIRHEQSII